MGATFPAAARLHRPLEYASALKGKRVGKGALFVITTPREHNPQLALARLGLVIAKRYAAKAVTRNTIKRVLRESFRVRRHALPPNDYVFRLHSKVGPFSLTELKTLVREEADILLNRASR